MGCEVQVIRELQQRGLSMGSIYLTLGIRNKASANRLDILNDKKNIYYRDIHEDTGVLCDYLYRSFGME